jgi:hypothetical protein
MTIHNADMIAAATTSAASTVFLAANDVVGVSDAASLASYIPAILGPIIVALINRYLGVLAARKRAKAKFIEAEAKALEADTNPENDIQARDLRLEAETLREEAKALVNGAAE